MEGIRTQFMHVAHFIQRYPPALGGSESYFARLGEYLNEHGDDVTVWTTTAVELSEFWSGRSSRTAVRGRLRKYRPLTFPARRYLLKALSLISVRSWQCLTMPCNPVCPAMWRDAGRYDGTLDAVHASAFPYAFPILCGLRLARRRGVPFFLTPFLHLGDEHTRKQYTAPHLRWLLKQADRVFVQTNLERDAARDLGVKPERIVLQGLGVDANECTGGSRVECVEPVIGHLANASVEKGTVDLLKAAAMLWERGAMFRVVLAGPTMPNFLSFWRTFPYKDCVAQLGIISDEQKRDVFASIDVFALPSRSDSFGLVLLEAWANGKPNLVYRAGGPGEIVRDGVDGLHAACGNVDDLAQKLIRLVNDAELRKRLGESGRSRLADEFRWEDSLEIVRAELHGTLRRPRYTLSSVNSSLID